MQIQSLMEDEQATAKTLQSWRTKNITIEAYKMGFRPMRSDNFP
jgi:hypothetical protein